MLNTYDEFVRNSQYDDLSDQAETDRQSLATRGIAAVNRIAGQNSSYSREIIRIQREFKYLHENLTPIMGVVKALKTDLEAGYIKSLIELAHGDIFANFLEMAKHLLESGYKDAAAVISGSTLESHLRELCSKNGISTENSSGKSGTLRPLKADRLNSELAKASILTKLDQKNVTAWLDLRNKAAHGNYNEYSKDQVSILISGICDFISRIPA